jgi:SAM-dependent methyltransferase
VFSASAELYDLIYSEFKDYPAEARQLAAIIGRAHPRAHRLLDVACGTAEHARLLTEEHGFHVDGLDLEPGFVRIARGKLPRGRVHAGDMRDFELPGRYDAILCLFSSIGYVRTPENLRRTFARFRAHLAEGGVVLVEPWFPPEAIQPGRVGVDTARAEGLTVCRMSRVEVEGRLSRLHFHYLLGRAEGIEPLSEVHELGLFTVAETLEAFEQAGLRAEHDPQGPSGRGLYVARAK